MIKVKFYLDKVDKNRFAPIHLVIRQKDNQILFCRNSRSIMPCREGASDMSQLLDRPSGRHYAARRDLATEPSKCQQRALDGQVTQKQFCFYIGHHRLIPLPQRNARYLQVLGYQRRHP